MPRLQIVIFILNNLKLQPGFSGSRHEMKFSILLGIDQEGATGWELHVSSCVGMGEHESYHHPMWLTPPPPSLPTPARTIADPNKVFLIFT